MATVRNICAGFILFVMGVTTLSASAVALYAAKSALGIDLFKGPSVFHGLIY